MRRRFLIWILLSAWLLPAGVYAHRVPATHTLLSDFFMSTEHHQAFTWSFQYFIDKLAKKHERLQNDRAFLQHVFTKTHQQYLKNYAAFASLDETFERGDYNCLTGTILYSLILHHFHIEHEVIETNYHIFILAKTKQGEVLLEATDPVNGFITSVQRIESQINRYKQNKVNADAPQKTYYRFKAEIFNRVSMAELRGLLYYNMAVNAFNQQKLQPAVQYLIRANALYASQRIEEFSQIMLLALQQSTLEVKTKEDCMTAILLMRNNALIASTN